MPLFVDPQKEMTPQGLIGTTGSSVPTGPFIKARHKVPGLAW